MAGFSNKTKKPKTTISFFRFFLVLWISYCIPSCFLKNKTKILMQWISTFLYRDPLQQGFATCGPWKNFWRVTVGITELECILQDEPLTKNLGSCWATNVIIHVFVIMC